MEKGKGNRKIKELAEGRDRENKACWQLKRNTTHLEHMTVLTLPGHMTAY